MHDPYRERLGEAHRRYAANRTPEARMEYLTALRIFTDLVVRYREPLECE
jgi:hypothetical protein